jgi:hypothetical protein
MEESAPSETKQETTNSRLGAMDVGAADSLSLTAPRHSKRYNIHRYENSQIIYLYSFLTCVLWSFCIPIILCMDCIH